MSYILVSTLVFYFLSPSFAFLARLSSLMSMFTDSSVYIFGSESLLGLPVVTVRGIALGESLERNLFVNVLGDFSGVVSTPP